MIIQIILINEMTGSKKVLGKVLTDNIARALAMYADYESEFETLAYKVMTE